VREDFTHSWSLKGTESIHLEGGGGGGGDENQPFITDHVSTYLCRLSSVSTNFVRNFLLCLEVQIQTYF
jgi:hypothetical protein